MATQDIVLDNPIFTKHLRTRLRPRQLGLWIAVVIVLCLSIVWVGQAWNLIANGSALTFLMGLQVIMLVFIGASQVGGAVGGMRESGIIDFHRVTPLPPFRMAVGTFLGAPIREYLLFALTLPFAFMLSINGSPGVLGWIELTIPLIFSAWVFHALAMFSGLASKKPKGPGKGVGGAILVFALIFGQPIGSVLWYALRHLEGETETIQFFGVGLHWLLFLLLYESAALGFLFLAATRKFRADSVHALSKAQALACMATFTTLVLGAAWNFQGQKPVVLVVLYLLLVASLFLIVTITPEQAEYVRNMRRAVRHGHQRPSPWEDAGSNRIALFAICAMIFLGTMASWELIAGDTNASTYSQTIAIGVFVAAYFGLGLQFFRFRLAKSGNAVMTFFLFIVWLIPVLLGSISFGVGTNKELYNGILSFSPVTGIAMSSGLIESDAAHQSFKLITLLPAITFAFVFNFLLTVAQRNLDRAIRSSVKVKPLPGPFDYLDHQPGDRAGNPDLAPRLDGEAGVH